MKSLARHGCVQGKAMGVGPATRTVVLLLLFPSCITLTIHTSSVSPPVENMLGPNDFHGLSLGFHEP